MIDEEPHTSIDFLGYFRLGDLVSSLMLSVSVKHNVIFMWLTNSYRAAFFFFFFKLFSDTDMVLRKEKGVFHEQILILWQPL